MAKLPPERLAAALKTNLKRRKQMPVSTSGAEPAKDHEKLKENSSTPASRRRPGT